VDAGALWAGGAATAIVAGLIALAGVLACRWLFNIPILAPRREGAYGDVHTTTLVLVAAGAALVATLVAHLLLISTPRPMLFFGWIVALVTVVMVIFPFQTGAPLAQKVATAAVYLVIGVGIGSLISGVGERAVRRRRVVVPPAPDYPAPRDYPGQGYPGQGYPGQGQPGQGQSAGRDYPGQGQSAGRDYPARDYPGQGYPGREQPPDYPARRDYPRYPGQDYPPTREYPTREYPER
jgi:hypothetical protein